MTYKNYNTDMAPVYRENMHAAIKIVTRRITDYERKN